MNRYINSADALNTLKQLAYETALNQFDFDTAEVFEDLAKNRLDTWVDLIPTADVQEVNHGTWTEKEVIYIKDTRDAIDAWQSCRCSICGRYHTQPYMYYFSEPNYCSFCGASMKEEATDAQLD